MAPTDSSALPFALFFRRLVIIVAASAFFVYFSSHQYQFPTPSRKLAGASSPTGSPAPVCDRLDCPPFKAVHVESDFEIRLYAEASWAETEPLLEASFNKATRAGFRRLFKYISGHNEDDAKIPMTAPVLTTLKPTGGPFSSSSFTVKFLVPPEFSEAPPKPKEDLGVSVEKLPPRCVAIRRFPGFATDVNVARQATYLSQSLDRTAWANVSSSPTGKASYAIAQYNDPFTAVGRVNEVWVVFESEIGNCTLAASSRWHSSIELS